MSDATSPGKTSGFSKRGFLSGAGRAGPRRLFIIGISGLAIAAVLAGVTLDGKRKPVLSSVARMNTVDANPGGLNSDQEQDALAERANNAAAYKALKNGISYTPPMAPSVPSILDTPAPQPVEVTAAPLPTQHFAASAPVAAPPPPPMVQQVDAPVFPPPLPGTVAAQPAMQQTADNGGVSDPQAQNAYTSGINSLFSQWNGRPPVTDVVLPPLPTQINGATSNQPSTTSSAGQSGSDDAPSESIDPDPASPSQHILIPAGRGIFAHPVLALSSDAASPVILQADSGPIAGDRMVGNFSRENDRLIIYVSEIIHNGQSIGCSGVVIAPDTMEAAVASGVNQHYISRFLLPAAAAFVEGLGAAIATTSNTTQVLSPLGGATTSTNLNIRQQLAVGAGAAAQQLGTTLDQDAPKGPTVSLDANVGVGVMFLTDVKAPGGS